jgi:hypothetical protein
VTAMPQPNCTISSRLDFLCRARDRSSSRMRNEIILRIAGLLLATDQPTRLSVNHAALRPGVRRSGATRWRRPDR